MSLRMIKTPMATRTAWQTLLTAAAMAFASSAAPHAAAANADPRHGFVVTSEAAQGGSLPDAYACDGAGKSPPLSWANAPAGTTEFAVLMSTIPPDGHTKYNWVLYGIPGSIHRLAKNSQGIGTPGVGSNGNSAAYQPPCSKGAGPKTYTFTVYALSAAPELPSGEPVSGARGPVARLVTIGLLVTFAGAAATLLLLADLPPQVAVVTAAMVPVLRDGRSVDTD